MSEEIPKEVNPKIGALVAAIGKKRRELGLLEWGQLSIEEVVERLKEKQDGNDRTDSGPKQETQKDR